MFSVMRRVVPAHGIKIGCVCESVHSRLTEDEANRLADELQAKNPDEEYAVTELVFRRWTKESA
jgi:hypothetical protein